MKSFFVALWSRQTEAVIGPDVRLQQLKDAVDAASKKFSALAQDKFDGAIKWIFVAPEYLFTNERAEGDLTKPRSITTEAFDKIGKELQKISVANRSLLMIPGTVIYQHSISEQTGGEAGAIKAVTEYKDSLNPDAIKGPAKGLRDKLLTKVDATPQSKLDALQTPQAVTEVVKNRLYVFLDGKVVAKYGKKTDKHEVTGPGTALFIPGQDSGMAKIEGIDFGFEICYDHEMGVLKAISGDKKVDIHVVVSAWVTNNTSCMQVRGRGYFLHASSDSTHSAVFYKPKPTGLAFKLDTSEIAKIPDIKDQAQALDPVACAGGTLNCYVLPYLEPL